MRETQPFYMVTGPHPRAVPPVTFSAKPAPATTETQRLTDLLRASRAAGVSSERAIRFVTETEAALKATASPNRPETADELLTRAMRLGRQLGIKFTEAVELVAAEKASKVAA